MLSNTSISSSGAGDCAESDYLRGQGLGGPLPHVVRPLIAMLTKQHENQVLQGRSSDYASRNDRD